MVKVKKIPKGKNLGRIRLDILKKYRCSTYMGKCTLCRQKENKISRKQKKMQHKEVTTTRSYNQYFGERK